MVATKGLLAGARVVVARHASLWRRGFDTPVCLGQPRGGTTRESEVGVTTIAGGANSHRLVIWRNCRPRTRVYDINSAQTRDTANVTVVITEPLVRARAVTVYVEVLRDIAAGGELLWYYPPNHGERRVAPRAPT